MTRQEAFDKVWDWFAVQGKPLSKQPDGGEEESCYYRHPQIDARCALGVLIPDDKYDPTWEDSTAYHLAECGALDFLGEIAKDRDFLRRLQRAHDWAGSPGDLKLNLRALADDYGLEVPDAV